MAAKTWKGRQDWQGSVKLGDLRANTCFCRQSTIQVEAHRWTVLLTGTCVPKVRYSVSRWQICNAATDQEGVVQFGDVMLSFLMPIMVAGKEPRIVVFGGSENYMQRCWAWFMVTCVRLAEDSA